MKTTTSLIQGVSLIATLAIIPLLSAAPAAPADPGWPRVFSKGKQQLTIYQPQVDSWTGFTTTHYRYAFAIKGVSQEEKLGVAEVDATTLVDQSAQVVGITPVKRDFRFPDTPDDEADTLRKAIEEIIPAGRVTTLSLERMLAYVDPAQQPVQRTVEVNTNPPKIFHSGNPAILVMFMGEPEFKPVEKGRTDLMFAINTNWDVFYDTALQRYYLLNGGTWLSATDVKGPWTPAKPVSGLLQTLPDQENWADVRKATPGEPAKEAPVTFVITEPAEIILTKGDPSFTPIRGTQLMRVTNSDSPLFLDAPGKQYYFLVAGRWFRAENLDGPWTSASKDLPANFAMIPDGDPAAYVKSSVAGTQDARDAVMLASIPNTTSVDLAQAKLEVTYSGEPKFTAIEGTSLNYAVNASETVLLVDAGYYCCSQGVWFNSSGPVGPWLLCSNVPPAIYTIPASHPTHNVTYVTVQSSTPTTVVYNQTSGYSGEYVATNGVLMFGAGMLLGAIIADHHDYYHYPAPVFYSYGCGAVYHHGFGGYHSSASRYYGPYGGAGRVAAYNPGTGTYQRGAYAYGPAGSASVRQAYNPYTGGYAQAARVNTPYGSAGRFYAEQGGKSVAGGYRSGSQGTVGGIKTNNGTGAVAWNTNNSQGTVIKGKNGNLYAGKDGNVYKRDSNGDWQTNNGNRGNNSLPERSPQNPARPTQLPAKPARPDSPSKPDVQRPSSQPRPGQLPDKPARPDSPSKPDVQRPSPQPRPAQLPANVPASTRQSLDRDAQARTLGNRPAPTTPSASARRSSGTGERTGTTGRSSGGGRSSGKSRGH